MLGTIIHSQLPECVLSHKPVQEDFAMSHLHEHMCNCPTGAAAAVYSSNPPRRSGISPIAACVRGNFPSFETFNFYFLS